MCISVAFRLKDNLNVDPTIGAFCEIEATLDAMDAMCRYDEACDAFADVVPISIEGCSRKAEMAARWVDILANTEYDEDIFDTMLDRLRRNAESLAKGMARLSH